MAIKGFEQFGKSEVCIVLVSDSVVKFLSKQKSNANRKKNTVKVGLTLNKLNERGLQGVNNTEQFVHEGKFPSGRPNNHKQSVYAVKSGQIRIYGGLVGAGDRQYFLCVEGAIKQQNRADQNQLRRVAKYLGDCYDKLG